MFVSYFMLIVGLIDHSSYFTSLGLSEN